MDWEYKCWSDQGLDSGLVPALRWRLPGLQQQGRFWRDPSDTAGAGGSRICPEVFSQSNRLCLYNNIWGENCLRGFWYHTAASTVAPKLQKPFEDVHWCACVEGRFKSLCKFLWFCSQRVHFSFWIHSVMRTELFFFLEVMKKALQGCWFFFNFFFSRSLNFSICSHRCGVP